MKFNELPNLTAMSAEEVKSICAESELEVIFNDLSNGRYDFPLKRVVRYKIKQKDNREVLVCDITGFPILNYE